MVIYKQKSCQAKKIQKYKIETTTEFNPKLGWKYLLINITVTVETFYNNKELLV